MTGKSITTTTDRDLVDGARVDTRATEATIELWDAPTQQRTPKKTTLMHEVMLTDGRVFYQCAMRPDECHAYSTSAASVNAHMKTHGPRAELKRAQAKLDALQTHQAQVRANRANGARKAAETRKNRATDRPTAKTARSTATVADDPRTEIKTTLTMLRASINRLAQEFDARLDEVDDLLLQAAKLLDALPVPAEDDPDLRALANLVKQIAQK